MYGSYIERNSVQHRREGNDEAFYKACAKLQWCEMKKKYDFCADLIKCINISLSAIAPRLENADMGERMRGKERQDKRSKEREIVREEEKETEEQEKRERRRKKREITTHEP